jgi:hypothetical protein
MAPALHPARRLFLCFAARSLLQSRNSISDHFASAGKNGSPKMALHLVIRHPQAPGAGLTDSGAVEAGRDIHS